MAITTRRPGSALSRRTVTGTALPLDYANGGTNYDNSWPGFSPDVGTFRGDTLYWVAFSCAVRTAAEQHGRSRRFAAAALVSAVTFAETTMDPELLASLAPWPELNGGGLRNDVPQWVRVAITIDKP